MRIDVGKEEVLVEASLTSHEVQGLIGSTGRRAVLKGIGGTEQGKAADILSDMFYPFRTRMKLYITCIHCPSKNSTFFFVYAKRRTICAFLVGQPSPLSFTPQRMTLIEKALPLYPKYCEYKIPMCPRPMAGAKA